jgi:hypothetical protein
MTNNYGLPNNLMPEHERLMRVVQWPKALTACV